MNKIILSFIFFLSYHASIAQYKLSYTDTLMYLGTKAYQALDLTKSKEKLDSCILLNPLNDECKYYRAKIEYDMKSYPKAAIMFKNVLALKETDASSWHMLGLCYTKMKHYDSAEFCFQNAVKINSKRSEFYANWGNNQFLRGKIEHSEELYNTAILLDDKNPDYYTNRAEIRSKLGDKIAATEDLNRAIQIDPNHLEAKKMMSMTAVKNSFILYLIAGLGVCAFVFLIGYKYKKTKPENS